MKTAKADWHTERLTALWGTVTASGLRGDDLRQAMLRECAAAMRPDQAYAGSIGHIEGTDYVLDAVSGELGPDAGIARRLLPANLRIDVRETLHARDLGAGRTQSWNDCQLVADLPLRTRQAGIHGQITTQFFAGGVQYILTLGSLDPPSRTPFNAQDYAYIELLGSFFARQMELEALEASLRTAEANSRYHAQRLEALWKLVNDPRLQGEELQSAMLRHAAAAINPEQLFRATLWRIKGDEVVVEAVSVPDGYHGFLPVRVGVALPIARTIVSTVLARGGTTIAWDDVQTVTTPSMIEHATATRGYLVTTFRAGASTWGLTFASAELGRIPFAPEDRAYMDVLASYFSNHVQQRWQFERIQYQQSHDVLTGLLNRSQFRAQARAAAHVAARYAIILIGVDAFREINATYGNTIGDALLVEIGNALTQRAHADEIVGRVGGDVFGVYIPDVQSSDALLQRASAFSEAFARPFSTGDREATEFISRTASIGVSVAPDDGSALDAILAHADAALVNAKQHGHGSMIFYRPGMDADAQRRATLRNELVDAIALDQFELYYQPHVELSRGSITGCEALIRWNHPTRGLLLPGAFIPFAEQSGIITAIDEWVMNHAFATAKALAVPRPGFRLYFNLSGRQAGNPALIRAFVNVARSGVKLEAIGVEITETDAMRDVVATRRVCRALRRLNVRIAIDDFGTGYSSLSSLKQLPVDIVKIDRSFIAGFLNDSHDQTIAETILSITERFGFDALAEGVEHPEEIAWLRERSCRYAQGYAICHPLPLAAFEAWLATHELGA